MRLLDAILLSFSAVFFIIGVHQIMTLGLAYAYWLMMLSVLLLFWYTIRKKKRQPEKTINQRKEKKRNPLKK